MASERKFGRFFVGRCLIDDNFGELVYRGLIPFEVRYVFDHDGFEVLALGEMFEPVPRGMAAPRYRIEIDSDEAPPDFPGCFPRRANFRVRFVKEEAG